MNIHPTAIIDPSAHIADDVTIGPYSIIGANVTIGSGCEIGPHVVIKGHTTIGKNNRIFQFATVGEDCQDKKYKGEQTFLEIGDNNMIRENCTIHRGTVQDNSITRIGSGNLFMVNTHIAHDCIVGDDCIFANNSGIAGHVKVGNSVIIGGNTGVHQFCQIGSYAMTGGASLVLKDIPAYVMVFGNPAEATGMNFEGMRRRGWTSETIGLLKRAYKIVYRQGLTLEAAISQLEQDILPNCPEAAIFIDSLKASTRGITR
ncbi:MAG TPA: acyl-ACP--UDP-N-acetylglucosamine O-acyltransferase [Agitococcus sp.]|nr:acyl-ACP--UDP-N-acetylglucosamine O-acyltransferase [Agitococcus sp.]HMV60226.1 acyl-ACP--UDP-N-acetylglucosamine O-acyltransferase [Agitococcus sp.]HMX98562.1 acyl-ACP--UDP-N-acetylglucosamine O-acyltransferase [Agitococcus sp.]HMY28678.1 acyl-ACP--UDP-N-acetylglucosamine O-acyltransferase [Agitococcus sp.]HMY81538.1 acyl-ACP--UDP-N-acetylglucosamine O-acyltransferase [Agitococcus sp.]